jgi:hypothetical protein
VLGGESQRASLNQVTGYSEKAQCTGKPAYLEPISGSLQKPVGGLSEKTGEGVAIGAETRQKHVENQPKPATSKLFIVYIRGYSFFSQLFPDPSANKLSATRSS